MYDGIEFFFRCAGIALILYVILKFFLSILEQGLRAKEIQLDILEAEARLKESQRLAKDFETRFKK